MAVTLTKLMGPYGSDIGPMRAIYNIAWDASYPTGGEIIDITDKFSYVMGLNDLGQSATSPPGSVQYLARLNWDRTAAISSSNLKVMIYDLANGQELANATDLSAIDYHTIEIIGF